MLKPITRRRSRTQQLHGSRLPAVNLNSRTIASSLELAMQLLINIQGELVSAPFITLYWEIMLAL